MNEKLSKKKILFYIGITLVGLGIIIAGAWYFLAAQISTSIDIINS